MSAYIDTHIAVWLAQGDLSRISSVAIEHITKINLLISPMALLELEYLYEVRRILFPSRDLQIKLEHELGVKVCDFDFKLVIETALNENWTRDPFDRIIVAHAKANGFSSLISADEEIRQHYPRTIW